MLGNLSSKDLIKYLIIIGILYTILKIMPSQKLNNKDIVLLVVVILIIFIIIDYKCFKSETESFSDINSDIKDKLESIVNNINTLSQQAPPSLDQQVSQQADPQVTNQSVQNVPQPTYQQEPQPTYQQEPQPTYRQEPQPTYRQEPQPTYRQEPQPTYRQEVKPTYRQEVKPTYRQEVKPTYRQEVKPVVPPTLPPKTACSTDIDKIRRIMQSQIDELKNQLTNNVTSNTGEKYFNYLLNELVSNNTLNDSEVQNIKNKIQLKLLTIDEVITSLESLKGTKIKVQPTNDSKYNELPSGYFQPIGDKISNDWDNQDAILNTDRWTVPMPRPPVCITSTPCKVCPSDPINQMNLKDWNNNTKLSNTFMNKKWISDNTINN